MKKIVLMGYPGSGKSAVCRELAKRLNLEYISSGDIARSLNTKPGEMCDEKAMRKQLKNALTNVNELVLHGVRDGFVLDGCPRFVEQAIWLNTIIGKYDICILAITAREAISRLMKRNRADDCMDIILKRLADYHKNTYPIISDNTIFAKRHIIKAQNRTVNNIVDELVDLL